MGNKAREEILHSARLELVPFTPELLLLAQSGDAAQVGHAIGAQVPEGWPPPEVLERQLPHQIDALHKAPGDLRWHGRLIVRREERMLIGVINVKGPPDAGGAVEIGYQVEPAYRGVGYATEAAHTLVDWLFQQRGVRCVRAKCSADNEASLRLLHGLGMRRIGAELTTYAGELQVLEAMPEDFLPPDDS